MEHPDNQEETLLADYLLGEMSGPEAQDFETRFMASPQAKEELEEMKSLFSLLSEGFEDEWRSNTVSAAEESLLRFAVNEVRVVDSVDPVLALQDVDWFAGEELAAFDEVIHLLRHSLADEWMSAEAGQMEEEIAVTSFALGEMGSVTSFPVEEVEAIKSFAFRLQQGFSRELCENDSVDCDKPDFTNYVVGELSHLEIEDYEVRLSESYLARKELEATRELVSLLSHGLEEEWKSMMTFSGKSVPEFSLVEASTEVTSKQAEVGTVAGRREDSNIQRVNFGRVMDSVRTLRSRQPVMMSMAAVLIGLLVVSGLVNNNLPIQTQEFAASENFSPFGSIGEAWIDEAELSARDEVILVAAPASPPNLMLMDELPKGFSLRAEREFPDYQDEFVGPYSGGLIPTAVTPQNFDDAFNGFAPLGGEFDSFLPPVSEGQVTYSFHEGSIEGREARYIMMSDRRKHENGLQSILLQGIVTIPEGGDVDLDSVFSAAASEPKGFSKELDRVTLGLESLVSDLDKSENFTVPEIRSRLIQLLEYHKELQNQSQSR